MSFNRSHIPYRRLTINRIQTSNTIFTFKTFLILILIFINFYLHYLRVHDFHRPLHETKSQVQPALQPDISVKQFELKVLQPFRKHLNNLENTINIVKAPSKRLKSIFQILKNLPVKPVELNQSEVFRLGEHDSNLPLSYYNGSQCHHTTYHVVRIILRTMIITVIKSNFLTH